MSQFLKNLGAGLGSAIVILALCIADAHSDRSGCSGHERPATCPEICDETGVAHQVHPLYCSCHPQRQTEGADPDSDRADGPPDL